jgi:hypothetical protein
MTGEWPAWELIIIELRFHSHPARMMGHPCCHRKPLAFSKDEEKKAIQQEYCCRTPCRPFCDSLHSRAEHLGLISKSLLAFAFEPMRTRPGATGRYSAPCIPCWIIQSIPCWTIRSRALSRVGGCYCMRGYEDQIIG